MKVAIHQPDYLPWLGLFYKMYKSDVFIHLVDVQFSNQAAHNYNVIKTPQGSLRLKFPVELHFGDTINTVRPKDELNWKIKHLRTIEMNYSRAKYFKEIFPDFKDLIMAEYKTVAELNIAINQYIASKFGINPKFLLSSDFDVTGVKEEKVINLCMVSGATEYISGIGAKAYQKEEHFKDRGLSLSYLDYSPIEYPQLWGDFLPCMSVVDYILNCGYDFDRVIKEVEKQNGNR